VVVTPKGAARLRAGHVWIYRSDVTAGDGLQPGAVVGVEDARGKPLGTAFYSSASQIALRFLTQEPAWASQIEELLRERFRAAFRYREQVVRDSSACRLVFSEADGLPGLIVDRYSEIAVLQALTQAWDQAERKRLVVDALAGLSGIESVVERVEPRIRELEQLPVSTGGLLHGAKTSTVYAMNGVSFHYQAAGGQKTGAFLDQRENYAAAEGHARGRALDVFCYQGGFALHLARRCSAVTAVDSSRPALETAEQNEALNRKQGRPEIEWMEANAFDLLKDYAAAGKQYETIVLDPPAFAKSKRELESALRGYKELNLRAMKMLAPGGTLVTCSCSYHLPEADFQAMLASAAGDTRRSMRILEKRGQAQDHPAVLTIPETSYLKCYILQG
jgi:23S rRNA (cytosine1962-C5)-methyltransferase